LTGRHLVNFGGPGNGRIVQINYRHAFHAGNFADVLKHVILARILVYLTRKESPFRFIDTHAGAGPSARMIPRAGRSSIRVRRQSRKPSCALRIASRSAKQTRTNARR
jgi:hypothetical protein